MLDLISIGSISFDIFFYGDCLTFEKGRFQLAVGGKYFVDCVHESLGGGGANVAIGAAQHNLRAAVYGKIGNNPFKKIILDKLTDMRVETSFCQFKNDYLNISSILLTKKGERTIIHYETPHQHIIERREDWHRILKTRCVYFGNLPEVSLTEKISMLALLKRNDILTVMNLGVRDCRRKKQDLKELLDYLDILILNDHEFADLVKAPYKDLHFHDDVVKWYFPSLKNKIIVITCGSKGSFAYQEGRVYHQKAIILDKIVDTTGAGDAYCAGFISQYLKNQNIGISMLSGTRYAVKILGKIGAN